MPRTNHRRRPGGDSPLSRPVADAVGTPAGTLQAPARFRRGRGASVGGGPASPGQNRRGGGACPGGRAPEVR
ncbi:MAG: hypothetical protein MZW92_56975 [Comamonadaceae bacterium]|nr:hypothetical protein [Comamonadaceae bacterium]